MGWLMSDKERNNEASGGLESPFRRKLLMGMAALPALSLLPTPLIRRRAPRPRSVNTTGLAVTDTEVTVGILHSVTGTMAISETGSIQAEKLAIEQINAMGGVLGRKIKFIQEDGASDWPTFAEKAKKLLVNDKCRGGVRLLDLGLAQGGAAGVREVERHALLPDLLRRPRAVEERDLHRPGGDAADHRRPRLGGEGEEGARPSS